MSEHRAILHLLGAAWIAATAPAGRAATGEAALSAVEIVQRIDAVERVASSRASVRQTITTAGGEQRVLEMEAYSRDHNDRQLLVYTAPQRVAGDRILMLDEGDEIWFYTPRTDRVRHLASHARRRRVQGSDFAYEDLAGGSIEKDYAVRLLGEEMAGEAACYRLELVPNEGGPSYARLELWADRQLFLTRRIDYYDAEGLLKQLTTSRVQQVDGHWYPMRLEMANRRDGGTTVMETVEAHFDEALDEGLFTTRALRQR